MKKILLILVAALTLVILILPVSCRDTSNAVTRAIVQVELQSFETGQAEFASYGISIKDGAYVLTVIDFENYSPDSVAIRTSDNKTYKALIEDVDPRSGLTLLQIQGATILPVAAIDELPSQNQTVMYWKFNDSGRLFSLSSKVVSEQAPDALFFRLEGHPISGPILSAGALVTSTSGKVIGMALP